jgi:hypothetical protein
MTQEGWTPARAYDEMKQYRFEGFPGHPELKKFVLGYRPSAEPVAAPVAAVIP